jgi:hypothetical protein
LYWKVIEIEHAERDYVMLIPRRRGLEEVRKQKRVTGDCVGFTFLNEGSPLMAHNVVDSREIAVRRKGGGWIHAAAEWRKNW